jgi:hypothetical protein
LEEYDQKEVMLSIYGIFFLHKQKLKRSKTNPSTDDQKISISSIGLVAYKEGNFKLLFQIIFFISKVFET